jgi:hypothetical protein
MPVNALARHAGLKIGPVLLETLIKRYFDRVKDMQANNDLKHDELMYDAMFNVIKVMSTFVIITLSDVLCVEGFPRSFCQVHPSSLDLCRTFY